MERIKVIDISYVQQDVDFEKVKAQGVKAVIIRTGYLGKTDTMFHSHMKGAIAAGLDIGVYTYMIADNTAEAVLEAQQTISRLEEYKGYVTYPVFCDMEHSKYYNNYVYNRALRTDMIEAFCNTISGAGYYTGVYINPSWLEEWTEKSGIVGIYDIWLAAWTDSPDKPTRYDYGQTMWQWGTETLDGIKGSVDGDICYVDYPEIIRAAGKNFLTSKCVLTARKEFASDEAECVAKGLEALGFTVTRECRATPHN